MEISVSIPYTPGMARRSNPKVTRFEMKMSADGDSLLSVMAERFVTSKASIVEQAIREYARQHGITAPHRPADPDPTPPPGKP